MIRQAITFMVFLLLLTKMQSVYAEIDAMELALLKPYQKHLAKRWENNVSEVFWLNEQQLVYFPQWKLQGVQIRPGQQHTFYLPAYESLRLYNPDQRLQTKDFSIYLSDGSGLLAATTIQTTTDGHSLIIAPQANKAVIVNVGSANQHNEDIELAVFISRQAAIRNIAPYRDLKWLSGQWVWMDKKPLQIPEMYWRMLPQEQQTVALEGPARILLKNRLHYESSTTDLFQNYRIQYRLDDNTPAWLEFATGAESRNPIFINSQQVTTGREQQAYIEIPVGQHRLHLTSDRELYLRVLQQSENDYLLPELNQPSMTVKTVREQGLLAEQKLPKAQLSAEDLAHDNSQKASALIAHQLLKQAALQRLDYPAGLTAADKIRRQDTFYRDLLPSIKHSAKDQFKAYFASKQFRSINQEQQNVDIAEQHRPATLNRLGSAYFNPLSTTADRYSLPERYSPSSLRIIADKRHCKEQYFYIQMDEKPAQKFVIRCQDIVSAEDAFVQNPAEKVLLDLLQQSKLSENATLSHLFAAYRKPAVLIPTAINEIKLPQQIKQLKVWGDAEQPSLNLALQIRAAKPYQFSEQNYLARLDELPESGLFKLFIENLQGDKKSSNRTEQQLQNEWIPLKRFITGLSRHYRSAVADKIPLKSKAKPAQLLTWKQQALQAEKQQQWTQALTNWNRIVESSQGQKRDSAQFAQAIILEKLSENYLAQNLLRYLLLYAQPKIATQAQEKLLKNYQLEENNVATQMLAANRLMQHPDRSSADFFLQALMQNNQYRFALILGLTLTDPPVELMLRAAYQLNWWQTYQQLLVRLPEAQQGFWLGLKAQKYGDYQTASEFWEKAGSECWLQHLQQGQKIHEKLAQNEDVSLLYKSWSEWQENYCGNSSWQDARQLVKDAAGTDQYYAVERDLYARAFRGTKEKPVTLRVLGPVKLNFKIRALHGNRDSELDGWLNIRDNQQHYTAPISKNKPIQGLKLIGEGDYFLGNMFTVEYQVGEGVHEIQLSSDDAPLSVKINEQKPELAITVLAPLQLDTFARALSLDEEQVLNEIAETPSFSLAIADRELSLKALKKLAAVKDEEQAQSRMLQYLSLLERQPKGRAWLLSKAEQLQLQFPEHKKIRALWNRISRYSEWQKLGSIVSRAGIRFVDTQGWQPTSPALVVRKALMSETRQDQHVVLSGQRLLLMMTNLAATKLHVDGLLDDLYFLPDCSAKLMIQIDDNEPQSSILQRSKQKKIVLQVAEGVHQIRFWIASPVANQFLKLSFQDYISDLSVAQEKSFFVSTVKQPLQIHVNGPAVIRLDEWKDGGITQRYQRVKEGWQLLTIPPFAQQQESLLQVRQRIVSDISDKKKRIASRITQRTLKPVSEPKIQLKAFQQAKVTVKEDVFKPEGQQQSTWSFGTDSVRRNNVQEDTERGAPEHFQQFSINHRYFDEYRNLYWNTQGFVRAREHGGPTFGFKESVYINPDNYPFNINLEAKVVSQIVHKNPEWLGQFKIAISQLAQITPKTSIVPKLSWFGRYLSAVDNDKLEDNTLTEDVSFKEKLDQDVFTNYKSDHSTGLSASLLFNFDPWLDTRWTAKINTVSNENMNFFKPDYFSTEAHWKQLLGEVYLDAGYRISFFQKDRDRQSDIKRQATKLKLGWDIWTQKKNRFEISGVYNYDIDRKAHLGMLSFSYHFGEGRGYRDFKPGDIDFRQIRTRQGLNEDD